ncbi:MAG TPA: hypothetical protein VFI42_01915 [Thermomicrobiaceae bacterium]|nr:hypothetical protein [Thermomicrobiaceae bacterium]
MIALAALAAALTACRGGSSAATTIPTPAPATAAATAAPSPGTSQAASTPPAVPQASPASPNATGSSRLGPPAATASVGNDKQEGQYGPYFWVRSDGLTAKDEAGQFGVVFALPDHALAVQDHQPVSFTFTEGPSPDQLELLVYPKDGHVKSLPAQNGQLPAFVPSGQPLSTAHPAGSPPSWSPDLQPGSYLIQLNAQWPNAHDPNTPLTASYAFLIEVR